MKNKKLKLFITIFSMSLLVILPILIVCMSGFLTPSQTKFQEGFNETTWYYVNENNEEVEVDFEKKLDVPANTEYSIYTYLNLNKSDDTLFIDTNQQRIMVYLDNELIYDNSTEGSRLFGKAEQSKFHTITLPDDSHKKKLTITYSSPYQVYSGEINEIFISSRRVIVDMLFHQNLPYLIIALVFLCSSFSLFISSFFFLSKYGEFKKMNYLLLASVFLSVFFIFESKLLTIFMHGYVSNISYISLILFNIATTKFIKEDVEKKRNKVISTILFHLNLFHLIAACFLQIFNVIDLFETVYLTLIFQSVNLIYFVFTRIARFKLLKVSKNITKVHYFEIIVSFILLAANIAMHLINPLNLYLHLIEATLFISYTYIKYSISINTVVHEAKKSIEYESELKETKNYLINSQMKSHFVFNTLGAIRTMIVSHPKMAYDMTTDFTKYLRANISNTTSTDLIPFDQELDHIKAYLNIELKRFQNRLKVSYDINVTDFKIPPLSVEPLVENAVKHGVCKKIKGGLVKIITKEDNENIYVIIEDDGAGFDVDTLEEAGKNGHVGLRYIKTRLKQLADADFEIISKVKEGTKATITIKK